MRIVTGWGAFSVSMLVLAGCTSSGGNAPADGGGMDAGRLDAGMDAAAVDAGMDAAAVDAGSDASATDAGMDAAAVDAGLDAAVATGCPTLTPGDITCYLDVGGLTRSYLVHVPPGYESSTPIPLVVNYPGWMETSQIEAAFSDMNATADGSSDGGTGPNFIVVYPQGVNNSFNAGSCCQFSPPMTDDVAFTRALVADIEAHANIDSHRVYATGMSNGGFMTERLACEAADLFAAFAPVAGDLVIDPSTCNPSRPVPIMAFHGLQDPVVPYYGSGSLDGGLTVNLGFPSIPTTMQGWADRDGCTSGPTQTYSNGMAHCDTWSGCNAGVQVVLCTIDDMGHCWPGSQFAYSLCPSITSPFVIGNGSLDISADDQMWAFFQQYTLP